MTVPPLLVIVSGPSGVGKDTALEALRQAGVRAHFAITATTRLPRTDEQDGVHYYFMSEPAFLEMLQQGGFLEHAIVYDRYYGVPKAPLQDAISRGEDVFIRVDVQGAATMKAMVPNAITVFLLPPSMQELEGRLRGRDKDHIDSLQRRMDTAPAELDRMSEFDYAVTNADGRLDETVDTIQAIVRAERCRIGRRPPAIP